MVAFACIGLLLSSLQVVSSFTPHQYCSRRRVDIQQTRIDVACFQTSGDSSSSSDESDNNDYFHHLISQFQGDFDNYHQVLRDRNHALTPAEGGGHEHIHCTLVPCPHPVVDTEQQSKQKDQWILAAFFFNGNPRQIFRFRMYKLISPHHDNDDDNNMDGEKVRMKLHTLSSELEQQLRQYSDQPCTWWRETYEVWLTSTDEEENEWETFQSEGIQRLVSPLVGCDVLWDPQWDPKKHGYLNVDEYQDDNGSSSTPTPNISNKNEDGCHATMEAGSKGAIVDSISMVPGKRILIQDELSLWENEFWINDRGYDPDAVVEDGSEDNESGDDDVGNMPFVYGNRRGIPYKLERVSCITSSKNSNEVNEEMSSLQLLLERTITKQEFAWTLGEEFRELTEYEEKLRAVEEALLKS